jgi:diadenosine tetraphosphate (Ap4A) HIT family hydrolase
MNKKINSIFTLRIITDEENYQKWKKKNKPNYCPFCNRDLIKKEFKYWLIIENRFPYSLIAEGHHLLSTKRHIKCINELTNNEEIELKNILHQINTAQMDYDMISYNTPKRQSIPLHFHLHLIKLKKHMSTWI